VQRMYAIWLILVSVINPIMLFSMDDMCQSY